MVKQIMSKIKNKIEFIKNYFFKNKRASILAYSLIVVSVMIVIAASISVVAVIEKKGAVSTDTSVQAYQVADSGLQLAIKKINKVIKEGEAGNKSVSDVFLECNSTNPDEEIFTGADYKLSFYSDKDGETSLSCSQKINEIKSIKSIGKYKGVVRAVQVSVE